VAAIRAFNCAMLVALLMGAVTPDGLSARRARSALDGLMAGGDLIKRR